MKHADLMSTDSEYRAFVERVTESLSARPGLLGQTVRGVVAGHATLAKVL